MSTTVPAVDIETLVAFNPTWNRHDIEALMSFMAEDCKCHGVADLGLISKDRPACQP